jgi:hypothetical protein
MGCGLWRSACRAAVAFHLLIFMVGRNNSYGAQDGLVTSGYLSWIAESAEYDLIVGLRVLGAGDAPCSDVCPLSGYGGRLRPDDIAEEPWLAAAYGDDYRSYCERVPRFFNWRGAAEVTSGMVRRRPP